MKEKKHFKETKVGKFLADKSPKILDVVGDVLPSSGVLGVVKNLINMSDDLTPDDKKMLNEEIISMAALEIQDMDSARKREIEISKLHKYDFMFYLTGLIGLSLFCFIVYAIVYLQIPADNKELWIHLIGITEGIVLSIFGYYFGSSIKRNVNPNH
jgi:hypothetical protein